MWKHPRPILTRKLCFNCGGPRFFERRGGIAERGAWGNNTKTAATHTTTKKDDSDANDSGYHSDMQEEDEDGFSEVFVSPNKKSNTNLWEEKAHNNWTPDDILEEEEDVFSDDSSLSPRSSYVDLWRTNGKKHRPKRQSSRGLTTSHTRCPSRSPSRSPLGRRQSWKPNLKLDIQREQMIKVTRRESIDSTTSNGSNFEDGVGRARRSQWSSIDSTSPDSGLAKRPEPRRKRSTLLHPSAPAPAPAPVSAITATTSITVSHQQLEAPIRERKNSTLLHPSSPGEEADQPAQVSSQRRSAYFTMGSLPTPPPSATVSFFGDNALSLTIPTIMTSPPTPATLEFRSGNAADTESFEDRSPDTEDAEHAEIEEDYVEIFFARRGRTSRASRGELDASQMEALRRSFAA